MLCSIFQEPHFVQISSILSLVSSSVGIKCEMHMAIAVFQLCKAREFLMTSVFIGETENDVPSNDFISYIS